MGDLISRSALIEAITQHGKDIKSDVPMIEDIYQTAHKHIIDLVEIQPTAFDIVKQRIAMMLSNTLRLICFVVLAVVFERWWIVLISILFFDYTERKD